MRAIATILAGLALSLGLIGAAAAEDSLKLAIGQRGGWEQSVAELGQNAGFFKRHGLALDILYTQGSAETLQSVISGSVDIGIGQGTHSLLGAAAKGAPLKVIGSSFTSADDQFYYVPADSPLKSLKEADGKSIAVSTTGSASHIFALALARYYGVNLKPQPTGNYASTLTQTLTKQVDIGFSQAPFNLNAVEDGKIRIIAMGRDVPELRNMTSRLIIANAGALEPRRDIFTRFMRAYRDSIAWLYTDPAGLKAYSAWSGMPERLARKAPEEFMVRANLNPDRIDGMEGIMADAVTFKYIPAPLTASQLKQLIQVPPP